MGYPLFAAPRFGAPVLAAATLALCATSTWAQEASATVVRDGDAALTCEQMGQEAAELSANMGEGGGGGLLGRARAVAETGAAILIPGAGLAMAGADALITSGEEREETQAQANRDRWNYLNGLYAGRGCSPQQTAEASPPAEPALAASAPPVPSPTVGPAATAPAITPGVLPR